MHEPWKAGAVHMHLAGGSRHRPGCEDETLALLQTDGAGGEPSDPELGTFGVEHDGDVEPRLVGNSPYACDAFIVLRMGAVGEVEPRDVEACRHHPAQHVHVVAGRTDGADYLGSAHLSFTPVSREPPLTHAADARCGRVGSVGYLAWSIWSGGIGLPHWTQYRASGSTSAPH